MTFYLEENDQGFPFSRVWTDRSWLYYLWPMFGYTDWGGNRQKTEVTQCPTDKDTRDLSVSHPAGPMPRSYGFNICLEGHYRLGDVERPASTVLLIDVTHFDCQLTFHYNNTSDRHNDGYNVLFCDQHIEYLPDGTVAAPDGRDYEIFGYQYWYPKESQWPGP
jgi:prepilin-type processing-associated H-X9-DG protein